MKPSDALAAHRSELRKLVGRHGLTYARVFGSVVNGTDTEESDLDLLDWTGPQRAADNTKKSTRKVRALSP